MKKIALALIILLVGIGTFCFFNNLKKEPNSPEEEKKEIINKRIDYLSGGKVDEEAKEYNNKVLKNYEQFKTFSEKYHGTNNLSENDFKENNYLIIMFEVDQCREHIDSFSDIKKEDNKLTIYVNYDTSCGVCPNELNYYLLKLDKSYDLDEYNVDLKYRSISSKECDPNVTYKPIIYLYPTKDMYVSIKLSHPELLTTTYPKYNDGWNVYVKKNGTIIDSNNREYYALYWEGTNDIFKMTDEGFVVKGSDSIKFFEDKLKLLGLTDRESNEFIMYWLPKLEKNKYNYIRFATNKEIENYMSLNIEPKPATTIRIQMIYKALDSKVDIKEQKISTPVRKGFTVVEWGGTELN